MSLIIDTEVRVAEAHVSGNDQKNVTISVITVCRNSEKTIVKTLDSVRLQDHKQIEHIIIDGSSVDRTVALVERHGTRVRTLISEPDRGIYDAMNKGLRVATGDLVFFLNADDSLADRHVLGEIAVHSMATSDSLVFGDVQMIYPSGRTFRNWRSGKLPSTGMMLGWMPPHPATFIRSEVFAQIGYFDPSFKISGDYEFFLRAWRTHKFRWSYYPRLITRMLVGGRSNATLQAQYEKIREDCRAMIIHDLPFPITLSCKIGRKIPQFMLRDRPRSLRLEGTKRQWR
jgi:glycosyltransferase